MQYTGTNISEETAASIFSVENKVIQKSDTQLEEIWYKNWILEVKDEQKCLRRTRI
jgi:hypothetical protein